MAQGLFQQWGARWLHLFANAESAKGQHFCVLRFAKRLAVRRAFQLDWNSGLLYAFLPIPLLPQVLKEIRTDQAQVILVALDWARRV